MSWAKVRGVMAEAVVVMPGRSEEERMGERFGLLRWDEHGGDQESFR